MTSILAEIVLVLTGINLKLSERTKKKCFSEELPLESFRTIKLKYLSYF